MWHMRLMSHEEGRSASPTAADLRAARARYQLRIFEVAQIMGTHPSKLGMLLNEKIPLTPELARRIHDAIHSGGERRG